MVLVPLSGVRLLGRWSVAVIWSGPLWLVSVVWMLMGWLAKRRGS